MNSTLADFLLDVRAAGTVFPAARPLLRVGRLGRRPAVRPAVPGRYVLRSWINDVTKPRVQLLTTRGGGRLTIAFRATDTQRGVDPFSVGIGQLFIIIGASQFDPQTGIVVVVLYPRQINRLTPGRQSIQLIASDYQETKNVNTEGSDSLPTPRVPASRCAWSTGRRPRGWCRPSVRVGARQQLDVVASSPAAISSVGFFVGNRQVARVRRGASGVFSATWNTAGRQAGRPLRAIVSDTAGREAAARRTVRVC